MTEEHQNERDEPLSESEEADFTSKAFRVLWQEGKSENDLRKELSLLLAQQVTFLRAQHNLNDYEVVFVWKDDQGLADDDVTAVYAALPAKQEPKKKVLMLLDSTGGKIEPAYLISKACKRLSQNFCVAIPRKAKSAATLISLGASEIHVGLSSELGPIDPQIGGIPAQALSNSLRSVAAVVSEYPGSAVMFSKFLSEQLNLRHLGYFERLNESAVQYGSRLLGERKFPDGRTSDDLARHLVYHYKDHSFVIDMDEALALFGDDVVRTDTKEYVFSKDVQSAINLINVLLDIKHNKRMIVVGSASSGITLLSLDSQ